CHLSLVIYDLSFSRDCYFAETLTERAVPSSSAGSWECMNQRSISMCRENHDVAINFPPSQLINQSGTRFARLLSQSFPVPKRVASKERYPPRFSAVYLWPASRITLAASSPDSIAG